MTQMSLRQMAKEAGVVEPLEPGSYEVQVLDIKGLVTKKGKNAGNPLLVVEYSPRTGPRAGEKHATFIGINWNAGPNVAMAIMINLGKLGASRELIMEIDENLTAEEQAQQLADLCDKDAVHNVTVVRNGQYTNVNWDSRVDNPTPKVEEPTEEKTLTDTVEDDTVPEDEEEPF